MWGYRRVRPLPTRLKPTTLISQPYGYEARAPTWMSVQCRIQNKCRLKFTWQHGPWRGYSYFMPRFCLNVHVLKLPRATFPFLNLKVSCCNNVFLTRSVHLHRSYSTSCCVILIKKIVAIQWLAPASVLTSGSVV